MNLNDCELSSPKAIVDAFAQYFGSVYIKHDSQYNFNNSLEVAPQLFVSASHMSQNDVFLVLKNCKDTRHFYYRTGWRSLFFTKGLCRCLG